MNFCPKCGIALPQSDRPEAKCPHCGWTSRTGRGTGSPPRLKKDLVIALAAVVMLLCLWKVVTHPQMLGTAGPLMATNIFGPFGSTLAHAFQDSLSGGEPSDGTNPAVADSGETYASNGSPRPASNTPPVMIASTVGEDTLVTNRVKVIVESVNDITDTDSRLPGMDAVSMARRLGEVGAQGGDIQISLSWNNFNDLDLHCIDPKNVEIWFNHTNSALTGGILDHDANAHDYTATPVENIYWPVGGAPAGVYKVYVDYYAQHCSANETRFTVRTVVKGQTNYFSHMITMHTGQKMWICSIRYNPASTDPQKRERFLNENSTGY